MQELETTEKRIPEVEQDLKPIDQYVAEVKITNDEQLTEVGEYLKTVQTRKRELEKERDGIIKPINDSLKKIREKWKGPIDRLETAAQALKKEVSRYYAWKEEQAREQQRKLEEQARKERERLAKRAEKAAEKGQDDKAEALQQQASTVVAPVVERTPPKVAGVSIRGIWKAEVTDKMALIKAVAEGKASPDLLDPNMKELNTRAKALKSDFDVAGVRAYEDKSVAA